MVMRILGEPDREYTPRNEVERLICTTLKEKTRQDISKLETRVEYLNNYSDIDDNPIDLGFDYVVHTSTKFRGYYFGGLWYGVNVVHGTLKIEELGCWNV